MPDYLRHPNGRGKLFDDAEANLATYIDRTSSASGSAKLRDCELRDGTLATDQVQVYGGTFYSTSISGKTIVAGRPIVRRSTLCCSEVSGGSVIIESELLGSTEVCDAAVIDSAQLVDAIVYGFPWIQGCAVTGRIHEGTWTRAPKHIKLPWCSLTECINGKVILDCRCRSYSYWMRHGAKLAKRWDWSDDQISVTLATIEREFSFSKSVEVVYSLTHGPHVPIPGNATEPPTRPTPA